MGISSLLNTPRDDGEWQGWTFNHAQDHLKIIQAIKQQANINLAEYQLDPVNFNDPTSFIRWHSLAHTDMNGVLGLQSIDLSEVDIKDENKLQAWIYSNYQEHNNAHERLKI